MSPKSITRGGGLLAPAALAAVYLCAAAGCSTSSAQRQAPARPPSAAAAAIDRAMEQFSLGREAALSGDFDCARDAFGKAVEIVRPAGGPEPVDPELIAFCADLYEGILRYEAMASPVEAASEGQGAPVIGFPETPQATQQAMLEAKQAISSDAESVVSDIPIVVNDAVLRIVASYKADFHDIIARGLARSGRYLPMIQKIFAEEGLPRDLAQVAMVESLFIPHARSSKAACGIWQFMLATGRQYGLTSNAVVDERNDPEKATRAAARYLSFLYQLFHDWYLAMAAYNAGEGKILRGMERTGAADFWSLAASGYIKPQTQNYVPAVIAATLIAKNPSHYGFEVEYESPLEYDTVRLDRPVHLRHLAAAEGVPLEELQRLNPELKADVTPRQPEGYELKIPVGSVQTVLVAYSAAPTAKPPAYRRHVAKRGETLASIARRFHVSVATLASANSLPRKGKIARGRIILIPEREPLVAVKSGKGKGKGKRSKAAVQTAQASSQPKTYRVRGGDTLYRIALRHGLTVAQILAVNSLPATGTIKPGDKLNIPKAR